MTDRHTALEPLPAADYAMLSSDDAGYGDLVRGRIVREPGPGYIHGSIQARLAHTLLRHVEANGLGVVLTESGFVLLRDPDTVRHPDVAFVTAERAPAGGSIAGYFDGAPDLAVEIVASGSAAGVLAKVSDYLDCGTRLVWVIDATSGSAQAFRSREDSRLLSADDVLDGADVVPGFCLRLGELLAG